MTETKEKRGPRTRVAIIEENNYHAETIFAFASACCSPSPNGTLGVAVFAPSIRGSSTFMADTLGLVCDWYPFSNFATAAEATGKEKPYKLVVVNTFPLAAGRAALELVTSAGEAVLGLVHDIHFFADPAGAKSVLERYSNVWLAHAGVIFPPKYRDLIGTLRRRVLRFFPVFTYAHALELKGCGSIPPEPAGRAGVALPGTVDFKRRDYSFALQLAARSGVTFKIFGGSKGMLAGNEFDLVAERDRLFREITALGLPPANVSVSTDLSHEEFYHTVSSSRFVGVFTVQPEYLQGQLTGAVTAAMSCVVPMLTSRALYQHYCRADPRVFCDCMIPLDADITLIDGLAPLPHIFRMTAERYVQYYRATRAARETLLHENKQTIRYLTLA